MPFPHRCPRRKDWSEPPKKLKPRLDSTYIRHLRFSQVFRVALEERLGRNYWRHYRNWMPPGSNIRACTKTRECINHSAIGQLLLLLLLLMFCSIACKIEWRPVEGFSEARCRIFISLAAVRRRVLFSSLSESFVSSWLTIGHPLHD